MSTLDATATTVPRIPAAASTAPRAARFSGRAEAFRRLLIRGSALLALTLGIYRFWLATDVRRFLWGHTEIDGESLEYNGTAVELLLGFLIAIALLIPLYVAFFLATFSMGSVGEALSALSFPLLAVLSQYALFRARRYRLTRTVFRGIRAHQTGSAVRYAICAALWWSLTALTLGLAYPFARARLERFKLGHTHYGNLDGRFEATGRSLFVRGLPMWLLVAGPVVLGALFALASIDWFVLGMILDESDADIGARLEAEYPEISIAIGVASFGLAMSVLMAALLVPAFQAMTMRWWLSGVRIGPVSVRSRLRTGAIYKAWLWFLLDAALFLVALAVVAGLVAIPIYLLLGDSARDITGAILGLVLYVCVMLAFSAIYQATVKLALWREAVDTAQIDGLAALDDVRAEGAASSAVGEGLADALSVGGI